MPGCYLCTFTDAPTLLSRWEVQIVAWTIMLVWQDAEGPGGWITLWPGSQDAWSIGGTVAGPPLSHLHACFAFLFITNCAVMPGLLNYTANFTQVRLNQNSDWWKFALLSGLITNEQRVKGFPRPIRLLFQSRVPCASRSWRSAKRVKVSF